MTRREEQEIKAFIADALMLRHLLNCVPHDPDLTAIEKEECLAYRSFSNLCWRFAHVLRRQVWKAWDEQRKEERKRKRAAENRRYERKRKKTR
ncbi:MAG: hypothetical protein JSR29_05500 [Nitrospira sp.]|nr:hypothetical protein [Nitrospira sp.]